MRLGVDAFGQARDHGDATGHKLLTESPCARATLVGGVARADDRNRAGVLAAQLAAVEQKRTRATKHPQVRGILTGGACARGGWRGGGERRSAVGDRARRARSPSGREPVRRLGALSRGGCRPSIGMPLTPSIEHSASSQRLTSPPRSSAASRLPSAAVRNGERRAADIRSSGRSDSIGVDANLLHGRPGHAAVSAHGGKRPGLCRSWTPTLPNRVRSGRSATMPT